MKKKINTIKVIKKISRGKFNTKPTHIITSKKYKEKYKFNWKKEINENF